MYQKFAENILIGMMMRPNIFTVGFLYEISVDQSLLYGHILYSILHTKVRLMFEVGP